MLQQNPVRALAVVSLIALTIAAKPSVPSAVDSTVKTKVAGITFDMVSVGSVQPAPPTGGGITMTFRGMAAANGAVRIELISIDGTSTRYTVGDYYLTVDGHAMLVRPATKTYVDATTLVSSVLNNMPAAMTSAATFGDVTGTREKVSSTEMIDGRATEHYKSTLNFSMNVMGQPIPNTVVTEYWLAKLPVKFAHPLAGGAPPAAATGAMADLIKKQVELLPPVGDAVPVKHTTATSITFQGRAQAISLTTEMKNIKSGDVDASMLALPAGYTKADK